MSLLKFFLRENTARTVDETTNDDPLAHPDLARMSLQELADLPLSPYPAVPVKPQPLPMAKCA
jgi:hypothetical protein